MSPSRSSYLILGAIALIVLVVFVPVHFSIGQRTIRKELSRLNGNRSVWSDVFNHLVWDGPTGSFTSGEVYAVRVGDLLWQFSISRDNSRPKP